MIQRLIFLSERFPPDLGGVARSAERIAGLLSEHTLECHVLTWTRAQPPGHLTSETRSLAAGAGTVTLHRFGLFGKLDLSLQHTMNVVEWLHGKIQFDAVWGHYLYPAGFVAVLVAKSLNLPSIVSARGNDVDRLMFPPGDFARLRWTLEHANRTTAVSQALADKINVLCPELSAQVIRNSVDSDRFGPAEPNGALRRSLGIAPDEVVLGFCGELRHKKGLPFLVSAFRQVRSERPACFLVIGAVRPRDESALIEYFADDLAAKRRMIVTGELQDHAEVAEHLRLCDLTLQPSVWDGLPNAVLESMACGGIVIGSDAGGIPEAIEHDQSGFLVPRAQLHRLGEAILEVLALPAERQAVIRAAARERMKTQFHPAQESASLGALLAGLSPKTCS